jgi:hypothetical protein
MSNTDKQRVGTVRKLEQLGYTFAGDDRMHPSYDTASRDLSCTLCWSSAPTTLRGCTEGSDERRELTAITDAIEAYEVVRLPLGRTQVGKGYRCCPKHATVRGNA